MNRDWCSAARVTLLPLTRDVQVVENQRRPGDWEVWAAWHGERDDDEGECSSIIRGLPDLMHFLLTVQGHKAWHYDTLRGQPLDSIMTDVEEDEEDEEPTRPLARWPPLAYAGRGAILIPLPLPLLTGLTERGLFCALARMGLDILRASV